jgi:hypothetical protein
MGHNHNSQRIAGHISIKHDVSADKSICSLELFDVLNVLSHPITTGFRFHGGNFG